MDLDVAGSNPVTRPNFPPRTLLFSRRLRLAMLSGSEFLVMFVAGIITGAMNAAAGGGSFGTCPALLLTGVPPIRANVTTAIGTVPSQFASLWAYRHDIGVTTQFDIRLLLAVSSIGGMLGAAILRGRKPWSSVFRRCAAAMAARSVSSRSTRAP